MAQTTNLSTHINDGPLLHHDGVVRRRGYVRLAFISLLEDEDAFHRLRQQICREEDEGGVGGEGGEGEREKKSNREKSIYWMERVCLVSATALGAAGQRKWNDITHSHIHTQPFIT